jgi:triosephosphate isomerase (TIM)
MKPLIAGNWKMNGTLGEARSLLGEIVEGLADASTRVDVLVCPPFTCLAAASEFLRSAGSTILVGGQDLHWEGRGAYTGEVSAEMLGDAGARFVLVGHSERRTLFGETGETLLRKLRAALRGKLIPILCIGESLADRESGRTESVLSAQLEETLLQLSEKEAVGVEVAYEPVWAIGTGRTATPEQAEEAHRQIRARISAAHGVDRAGATRILYGGSVNGENAASLLCRPGVDGALVGGASLKAQDFLAIVRAGFDASTA